MGGMPSAFRFALGATTSAAASDSGAKARIVKSDSAERTRFMGGQTTGLEAPGISIVIAGWASRENGGMLCGATPANEDPRYRLELHYVAAFVRQCRCRRHRALDRGDLSRPRHGCSD